MISNGPGWSPAVVVAVVEVVAASGLSERNRFFLRSWSLRSDAMRSSMSIISRDDSTN